MPNSPIIFPGPDHIDLPRVERSLGLEVSSLGRGRFHVTGGAEPHWVDLRSPAHPRCDCGDHLWRDQMCKHILAARLREGDEDVLQAVAELVQELRAVARAA